MSMRNLTDEIERITDLLEDLHNWIRRRRKKGYNTQTLDDIAEHLQNYRILLSGMRASGVQEMG